MTPELKKYFSELGKISAEKRLKKMGSEGFKAFMSKMGRASYKARIKKSND